MLRLRLGDERVPARCSRASTASSRAGGRRSAISSASRKRVAGEPLAPLFDDWIARPGAPVFSPAIMRRDQRRRRPHWCAASCARRRTERHSLRRARRAPDRRGAPSSGGRAVRRGREATFELTTPDTPFAVHVDPAFDVFRTLDPREVPPSIGQIFGEPRITAVLPSAAPARNSAAWRALAESWRSDSHASTSSLDRELTEPSRRSAPRGFSAGRTGWRGPVPPGSPGASRRRSRWRSMASRCRSPTTPRSSCAGTRQHTDKAVGWIVQHRAGGVRRARAEAAALRPLLVSRVRGRRAGQHRQGRVGHDRFAVVGRAASGDAGTRAAAAGAARRASRSSTCRRCFRRRRSSDHVTWLASPEREGRGVGTAGLQQAADYLAAQFKAAGLTPGRRQRHAGSNPCRFRKGPAAGRRRASTSSGTPGNEGRVAGPVRARHGSLRSPRPGLARGARGTRGRDPPRRRRQRERRGRAARAGAGARRRASVRRARSCSWRSRREEAGLLGARALRATPGRSRRKVIGVVNLDTVGRLGTGKVSVLGAGTATEWPHIFRGAQLRHRRREHQRCRATRKPPTSGCSSSAASRRCRSSRARTPTTTGPATRVDKVDIAGL